MKPLLNNYTVFFVLAVLAATFGFLEVRANANAFGDLWSQLFWLLVGVIATTFVLQTILEQAQMQRRRDEDAFAFRTFTANLLGLLLQIAGGQVKLSEELLASALSHDRQFAEVTEKAVQFLSTTNTIEADAHNRHYLSIASGLRDLSREYIRLFSLNRHDMIQTYKNLQDLASRWSYEDAITSAFRTYTASPDLDTQMKSSRNAETDDAVKAVQTVCKDTANCLSELAKRVATTRGIPAVS